MDMSEVITQSLEGTEGREEEPREQEEQEAPVEVEPQPQTPSPEEEAEEAEIAKLQQELAAANPKLQGKIDVPRHQAVLTRTRNQYEAKLKEAQERYEKVKWAEEKEAQAALQALALAESDPKAFVELLMKDKRYGDLLQFKEIREKAEEIAQRPQPNAATPDGQFQYYDDKGIEELLGWHGQQIESGLMKKLEARFGPIEQRYKSEKIWNEARERNRVVLEGARKSWKGFNENEQAIGQFLSKNPQATLHDAYREVVIPALEAQGRANKEALRKEILAEMSKKPKANTEDTRVEAERVADEGGKRSVADIVRANLPRE